MIGSEVIRGFHFWATTCFSGGDDSFGVVPWFPIEIEANEWALWFVRSDHDPGYLMLRGDGDELILVYSVGYAVGQSTPQWSIKVPTLGVSSQDLVIKLLARFHKVAESFSDELGDFAAEQLTALGEFFQQPRYQVTGLLIEAEGSGAVGAGKIGLQLEAIGVYNQSEFRDPSIESEMNERLWESLVVIGEAFLDEVIMKGETETGAPSLLQRNLAMDVAFPEKYSYSLNVGRIRPFHGEVISLTVSEESDDFILTHLLTKRVPKIIALKTEGNFPRLVEGLLSAVVAELLDILERAKGAKDSAEFYWVVKFVWGKDTYDEDWAALALSSYRYRAPAALAPYFMRWISLQGLLHDMGLFTTSMSESIQKGVFRLAKLFPESPLPTFLAREVISQVPYAPYMDALVSLGDLPVYVRPQTNPRHSAHIEKLLSAKPNWQAYSELFNEEKARKNIADLFEAWDY